MERNFEVLDLKAVRIKNKNTIKKADHFIENLPYVMHGILSGSHRALLRRDEYDFRCDIYEGIGSHNGGLALYSFLRYTQGLLKRL